MRLQNSHYGKADVRLTKVIRHALRHELLEYCVRLMLEGDFQRCYTDGDNSQVIPTDTMKNSVYALARTNDFDSPEQFGQILSNHYIDSFEHVSKVEVSIESKTWARIQVANESHDHAFQASPEVRTARVEQRRTGSPTVQGGIDRLELLKTTQSSFVGFLRDEFTTLADTEDRIFATTVQAVWDFGPGRVDYNETFERVRTSILDVFATHNSLAVQQTMYAIGERALGRVPAISQLAITMPNQHRLLANLKSLGLDNPNTIFVATSEPYGLIHATIVRDDHVR